MVVTYYDTETWYENNADPFINMTNKGDSISFKPGLTFCNKEVSV